MDSTGRLGISPRLSNRYGTASSTNLNGVGRGHFSQNQFRRHDRWSGDRNRTGGGWVAREFCEAAVLCRHRRWSRIGWYEGVNPVFLPIRSGIDGPVLSVSMRWFVLRCRYGFRWLAVDHWSQRTASPVAGRNFATRYHIRGKSRSLVDGLIS